MDVWTLEYPYLHVMLQMTIDCRIKWMEFESRWFFVIKTDKRNLAEPAIWVNEVSWQIGFLPNITRSSVIHISRSWTWSEGGDGSISQGGWIFPSERDQSPFEFLSACTCNRYRLRRIKWLVYLLLKTLLCKTNTTLILVLSFLYSMKIV